MPFIERLVKGLANEESVNLDKIVQIAKVDRDVCSWEQLPPNITRIGFFSNVRLSDAVQHLYALNRVTGNIYETNIGGCLIRVQNNQEPAIKDTKINTGGAS